MLITKKKKGRVGNKNRKKQNHKKYTKQSHYNRIGVQ
jgi:hypothetical protein